MKSKVRNDEPEALVQAPEGGESERRPARRRGPKNYVRTALHALRALIEQADAADVPDDVRERAQLVLNGMADALEELESAMGQPGAQQAAVYQALVEHALRAAPTAARLFGGGA